MPRIDWNRISDDQQLSGWRFDDIVRQLATQAAESFWKCSCRDRRVCIHAAAACLAGIIRIVDHPPDCPDCAELRAQSRDRGTPGDT